MISIETVSRFQKIIVHSTPHSHSHYNQIRKPAWDVQTLLETFSQHKRNEKYCLVHLFTHQGFKGYVLGRYFVVGHSTKNIVLADGKLICNRCTSALPAVTMFMNVNCPMSMSIVHIKILSIDPVYYLSIVTRPCQLSIQRQFSVLIGNGPLSLRFGLYRFRS